MTLGIEGESLNNLIISSIFIVHSTIFGARGGAVG